MQPCEALLPMLPGLLVPWMPNWHPRDVQPQKPRAEAPEFPRKTAGDAKGADGRRRIARAGCHGVALFDLRTLIEGEGLLRNINPDPQALRHVWRGGHAPQGSARRLAPHAPRAARPPAPASSVRSKSTASGRFHAFAMPRAPFALVLQPYALPVSDMPGTDGYVSHKKAARAPNEARAGKIRSFSCRCSGRGGRYVPRHDGHGRSVLRHAQWS